jgi:hypothetical protein
LKATSFTSDNARLLVKAVESGLTPGHLCGT